MSGPSGALGCRRPLYGAAFRIGQQRLPPTYEISLWLLCTLPHACSLASHAGMSRCQLAHFPYRVWHQTRLQLLQHCSSTLLVHPKHTVLVNQNNKGGALQENDKTALHRLDQAYMHGCFKQWRVEGHTCSMAPTSCCRPPNWWFSGGPSCLLYTSPSPRD